MGIEENKALVRPYVHAFKTQDIGLLEPILAPGFIDGNQVGIVANQSGERV